MNKNIDPDEAESLRINMEHANKVDLEEQMSVYKIGGPFFSRAEPPYSQGVEFNYREHTFTLTISYPEFEPVELEALAGPCQFGAFVQDDILFFLFRFGDFFNGDCPYNWWMNTEEVRTIPDRFTAQTRILLSVFVVNSDTNRIVQMRNVSIPPHVTSVIVNAILKQCRTPMATGAEYAAKLQQICDKFSNATMRERGVLGKGGE